MIRVYSMPTPEQAMVDQSNAINQITVRLASHLPTYGVEIVENKATADLIVAHAGQTDGKTPADVSHLHGLYPTAHTNPADTPAWHWGANAGVVENIRQARRVTVPSQWVAMLLKRDMHINPDVIGWAIDPDEWEPGEDLHYVLWGKTRIDPVCTPAPLIKLAALAPQHRFLTTFGEGTNNIKAIGRQKFEVMRPIIRGASVYLATTLETFGIQTLEAMACGVPVLGFRQGGTADIVQHGVTGYLVEPGDYDGLREGLEYCLKYRDVLGANARAVALTYTWDKVAHAFSEIYKQVLEPHDGPKVSVIIPCHNYERYVKQAIGSVKAQVTSFEVEIIVVLDRCTDHSDNVVLEALGDWKHADVIVIDFGNPADARNAGISQAKGDFITCLDADDALGNPGFLQFLADELDKDRTLGIAYTGLRFMNTEGELGNISAWPPPFDFEQQVLKHNQIPTCNLFRKSAWLRAGGYRRQYFVGEDAELWLRMGTVGFRAKQATTEPWFLYRVHENSLSAKTRGGKSPEPDWTFDKPWLLNGQRPFAADGKPPNHSWPVRNYDRPRIAFIVPCALWHRGILTEALDSIEGQTVRDWECVVVNDADIPLSLPSYPWVKIVNNERHGAGRARNRGIAATTAPLIVFLDADDILSPRFLEQTLKAYGKTGRYVYTDWMSLNKEGVMEPHETPEFEAGAVFHQTSIHSINVLIPRAFVEQVGGFDESMTAWEDVDFFMKLAAAGLCGTRVPMRLVMYRYRLGRVREHGETIKAQLKGLLRERFGDYIEGRKMCGCTQPKKKRAATDTIPAENGHGVMVRIEYVGAPGQHSVIGPETKTNYGRRRGGDTFFVYAKDQQADLERFIPITEVVQEMVKTPVPPEPQLRERVPA